MARPPRLSVNTDYQKFGFSHLKRLDPRLAVRLLKWYTVTLTSVMHHRGPDGTVTLVPQEYRAVDYASLQKLWKRVSQYKDITRRHSILSGEVKRLDGLMRATNDFALHVNG